jgi:hypothetical protein
MRTFLLSVNYRRHDHELEERENASLRDVDNGIDGGGDVTLEKGTRQIAASRVPRV